MQDEWTAIQDEIRECMTLRRAKAIQQYRLQGYTWRGIARKCKENFSHWPFANGHQLIGMFACEEAAHHLNNHLQTHNYIITQDFFLTKKNGY